MARQSSRKSVPPPVAASDGLTGVYGITVAAELAGMSVQALRLYERKGLLEPTRTTGDPAGTATPTSPGSAGSES